MSSSKEHAPERAVTVPRTGREGRITLAIIAAEALRAGTRRPRRSGLIMRESTGPVPGTVR